MKGKIKNRRRIEAADLCRLKLITSVALSPDEKKTAYTLQTISDNRRRYYSHIYVVNCRTKESRQYTYGEVSDHGIVWSPDGRHIAFISTRDQEDGIYILSADSGTEKNIINFEGTASSLTWTPDSRELVYTFRHSDSYYIKDKDKKWEAPLFRHITGFPYRVDGGGFLSKDSFHIYKLDIESGRTRPLTRGKSDDFSPGISPDGRWIAFCSQGREIVPPFNRELYVIPINGGKRELIPTPPGWVWSPVFSPDGKFIAYCGGDNPEDNMGVTNLHVWKVRTDGKMPAVDLIRQFDRSTGNYTVSDIGGMIGMPPQWSSDGKKVYFIATDMGNSHIFYVNSAGGNPARVTEKNCHVKAFSLGRRTNKIAAMISTTNIPSQLHLLSGRCRGDVKSKVIFEPNKKLLSKINIPKTKEVWFKSKDSTKIQGWLVLPPKFSKYRKYPAILQIHGGPVIQFGFTFYFEMLYLASNGYVVFCTNPRGSTGRGEAFAAPIRNDWGTVEGYDDLMAAADYLEKLSYVDAKRIGVTGGSYGGFMTNWIIGHSNRFAAAVTQRSACNMSSMVMTASGDMGRGFGRHPWSDPEWYRKMSPLTYAENIRTPLLILHSENDLAAKIDQADQLYTVLKLMKKKVEFVRFPEESHGLPRFGRPDRRIARLEWILKWFDKYLK